ncbi:leucyl/phenylalanyl-tRNA--protein transferase [Piscinibacter sakaiensis]|uniref:Leucyl/phenylalanyl-tRNA--protein transferase n=1 Tax=Piscinibacter sakaiensis TaxID=1547922 RepID=A0A0K8P2C5_PISS1|nr:leucyl/phenylalanyl-tRNA--protein transferase [Piscinibacter sakaiensis]GAP36827.1 leucyl/phenylalanyl-tRNA--protein transferase [Piscinibacter sakaiensis]
MITWLNDDHDPLPSTAAALPPGSEAPGLLAAGGRLDVARLREAYARGIFPWYGVGQPILWWSPDPRMVLMPAEFRLSRSLRKTIARFVRTPGCEVRIDAAPRRVLEACAGTPRPGQDGTWIVPAMVEAYLRWHAAGDVHSVETWVDGELVGGLYGVNLGRMFFGESMFAHRSDASKIALAALVCFCRAHAIDMIDCQQNTAHLASFGAREIPRREFERRLGPRVAAPSPPDWTYDPSLWRQLLRPQDAPRPEDSGP